MAPAGLIATSTNRDLTPQGVGGRLAHQHWEQITSYLRRTLSERHAALFAEPNPDSARGAIDWYGPTSGEALALDSLPDAARLATEADVARLVGDVRAQAERLAASRSEGDRFLGELLALALEIPDRSAIRLIGDQPVLAPWGHVSAVPGAARELLIRLVPTPQLPMQVVGPPQDAVSSARPLWPWLLSLLALLLVLMLLLLLLWRDPFGWFRTPAASCEADMSAISALADLRDAEAREAALRDELARLLADAGQRRLLCPPPPASGPAGPRLAPPAATSPVAPDPPPTGGLPPAPDLPPAPTPPVPPPPAPPPAESPPADARPPEPPVAPEAPRQPEPSNGDLDRAREEGAQQGEVQVILAWDDRNDLDLSVICPDGRRIDYRARQACGGTLDVDRNAMTPGDQPTRTPVENISFARAPQPGRYQIAVDFFGRRDGASSPYRVTIRQAGQPDRVIRGVAREGQREVVIGDFTVPPTAAGGGR